MEDAQDALEVSKANALHCSLARYFRSTGKEIVLKCAI